MVRASGESRLAILLVWIHRGEDILLAILLMLTLGVAIGQIFLRNFLGSSVIWADFLVRILVLWLGMMGAMIATRDKRHIRIDLVSRYLSSTKQLAVESAVAFFAGSVCAIAGYFSLQFVISEYQAGEIAFAYVPAWLCEAILPLAFIIIALRFVIQSVMGIIQLRKADPS